MGCFSYGLGQERYGSVLFIVTSEYDGGLLFLDVLTMENAPTEVGRSTFKATVYKEPTLRAQRIRWESFISHKYKILIKFF